MSLKPSINKLKKPTKRLFVQLIRPCLILNYWTIFSKNTLSGTMSRYMQMKLQQRTSHKQPLLNLNQQRMLLHKLKLNQLRMPLQQFKLMLSQQRTLHKLFKSLPLQLPTPPKLSKQMLLQLPTPQPILSLKLKYMPQLKQLRPLSNKIFTTRRSTITIRKKKMTLITRHTKQKSTTVIENTDMIEQSHQFGNYLR